MVNNIILNNNMIFSVMYVQRWYWNIMLFRCWYGWMWGPPHVSMQGRWKAGKLRYDHRQWMWKLSSIAKYLRDHLQLLWHRIALKNDDLPEDNNNIFNIIHYLSIRSIFIWNELNSLPGWCIVICLYLHCLLILCVNYVVVYC